MASLTRVVIMVRGQSGLASAVEFYHSAIGLEVRRVTDDWAELSAGSSTLHIQTTDSESQLASGYSPVLQFDTHDLDTAVAKAVQAGAHLDGPIQFPAHGKVAALRAPCGTMIGLYEPSR